MSCLDATFTLMPLSPFYSAQSNFAYIYCFGADFWAFSPEDFSSLYANNRFFFDANYAADPNLDYTQWANIRKARHLYSYIQLQSYAAANKQLALIFGFDVLSQGLDGVCSFIRTPAFSKTRSSSTATISFSSKSSPWIQGFTFTSSTRVATGLSRDSAATWSDTGWLESALPVPQTPVSISSALNIKR
jgi:hypothetical protein